MAVSSMELLREIDRFDQRFDDVKNKIIEIRNIFDTVRGIVTDKNNSSSLINSMKVCSEVMNDVEKSNTDLAVSIKIFLKDQAQAQIGLSDEKATALYTAIVTDDGYTGGIPSENS